MADHRHPVVTIVVFVSLGCFFFLCCCVFALWFFWIKKRKCQKKMEQERKIIRDDEHFKVKKGIVDGPHGKEAVVISMEKDKHFEEEIFKNEKDVEGKHMHGKHGGITATDVEAGSSPSNSDHQYIEYKH